jgi:hypothetical protein
VGLGPNALICTRCGGAFWGIAETPVNLTVQKNVLLVSFESGANEINSLIFRYRLSNAAGGQRMQLIGADSKSYWRTNGDFTDKSTNYLTGDRIVEQGGSDSNGNRVVKSSKKSRLTLKPVYLEDVKSEEYY